MNASKIKGSLLEYVIRNILTNCGFTKVKPDGKYIFTDRGLNFIHGKGASHDADVLMNPPIQMPFSYPYRINFECKAYNKKTGLTIVRNALGLRYDINEFEILTEEQLELRKNLRRTQYAIADRIRYNYQIGVASIEDFTKDAFEFAANNKIPLISLRWFLEDSICDLFHSLTDDYLNQIYSEEQKNNLLLFLKGNDDFYSLFSQDVPSHIKTILNALNDFKSNVIIGLLESGDMLFLLSNSNINKYFLKEQESLSARYTYFGGENLDYWTMYINDELRLNFYLPVRIFNLWRQENFNAETAINLKEKHFAKMFVFFKHESENVLKIISIDEVWINSIR